MGQCCQTTRLAGVPCQQQQTFLGFNPTGCVNLRVTFTLSKVTD